MIKIIPTLIVKSLIAFTFLLFISDKVSAQWPGYKTFSLSEDNHSIKINTLFKTSRGYIYVGTVNGLYKFDGESFTRIYFDNKDYKDTVTAIFEDQTQRMWVGFKSGRIAHLTNNKLLYYNPEEGTPQKKITAFLQDKEKNIWFATAGEGIYFIKNNRIYLVNEAEGMSDTNVSSLVLTENNDILAGTDQGINICTISRGKKSIRVIGKKNGLPDYIVTSIVPAGNDFFWIGLQEKGFCLYNHNTKQIVLPKSISKWNHGQVNAMIVDNDILWIGSETGGLLKYYIDKDSLATVKEATPFSQIKSLLQDNQGNVWVNSSNNGLIRTPGKSLQLHPLVNAPKFEHMHAILSDERGNIWVNDEFNRIIKYSMKDGSFQPQKFELQGLNKTTDITSLYLDAYGNIWIGTLGKGIYIFNTRTQKYRLFRENKRFHDASILSISGRGNRVFVSSLQGVMIIDLSGQNRPLEAPYQFTYLDNVQTGSNYIYKILEDSKKRLWFATDGSGLTMMENGKFTYYNDKKKIKDEHIYSVTEDNNGNIWFSTASAGIYKFDGTNFTNFSEKDGLSTLSISTLNKDAAGNIIIVHADGLDILDPATGTISYVSSNQGISTINAQDLGAITLDTAGNVMVSTADGLLTYHHPENSIQRPVTIIESVQIFLNDIDENRSHVFRHSDNNFTFHFTGLYYSNPGHVYYQYKLEGFDSTWILTRDKSKTFPRLDPGTYTFRIRSALNTSFTNADEASYHFKIKKPFYETWWFIIICTVVFFLSLYWYIKNRERSLKKLERLRQEKLEFQFEVLRNQVNPHFLFNSFNTLISTIEEDPDMAVDYVEQLSEFFRNIVNYRDKDIITLEEEITVLQTYFYIQQKRYGDNLRLDINISESAKKQICIPPLTLQLLLENAIKHNAISKEKPLMIELYSADENRVVFRNNINPKLSKQPGAGMGLQNIINRYKLLSNTLVRVQHDEHFFTVELPTLKNKV